MNIFPHDGIPSGALPTAMYLLRLKLSHFAFRFQVYWHSSAHIMGEAMERVYGGCLCFVISWGTEHLINLSRSSGQRNC